jgi:hypothetical protein
LPFAAPTGIAGAVVLPITGIGVGAVQMVRGVANSGEAIKETAAGKVWDEVRGSTCHRMLSPD